MNKVHNEFKDDRNNLLNEVKRTSRKEKVNLEIEVRIQQNGRNVEGNPKKE